MSPSSKTSLATIDSFLAQSEIAIAGVSRKASKFGNMLYKELLKKGFELIPVHPEMETYQGVKCYSSIDALPDTVGGLVVCTRPEQAEKIVDAALKKGIRHIWLQQGSENPHLLRLASESDAVIITGQCLMMFVEPSGIHKFHGFLLKLFGKHPK